ncbi:hypothetical protein PGT21_035897 [Puccinia graminis f. sp. tritici]|uniref:CENP-V/GFA domain-containing protein n=2 Tax=Puccinia graminis f. sp. tritici TaxID=56615 RepID=E3LBC8_PUCGT|nr:uncharacterized protein PGTG_19707 [Puccinia graminis f. sp. tritici CRL 75-36-700-3]EFP93853.2 hypothetical protein PGTG_19707 [Puccinia graminis f. sp. tritici CRL 75-36-700-3]KAA1098493.1 hypothetical protein PGT21_035897 [Puccinia graminis f. sp. tritici]KAA1100332.1 hypothetical protein PGTUg99_018182 [Puccinia graminis f. sp. tritici]
MPSQLSVARLGLMCTLLLSLLVAVKAPTGHNRVCAICALDCHDLRARNLRWNGNMIQKPCGELHTPVNGCPSIVPVKVYFCGECGSTDWVPDGKCRGQHNGRVPPERIFLKSEPVPGEPPAVVASSVGSNVVWSSAGSSSP